MKFRMLLDILSMVFSGLMPMPSARDVAAKLKACRTATGLRHPAISGAPHFADAQMTTRGTTKKKERPPHRHQKLFFWEQQTTKTKKKKGILGHLGEKGNQKNKNNKHTHTKATNQQTTKRMGAPDFPRTTHGVTAHVLRAIAWGAARCLCQHEGSQCISRGLVECDASTFRAWAGKRSPPWPQAPLPGLCGHGARG